MSNKVTAAPKRRRPTIRRVADDTKPVPVDLTGCIIKWLIALAIIAVLLTACVVATPFALALMGPAIEARFDQIVQDIQTAGTPSPGPGTPTPEIGNWVLFTDTSAIDDSKSVSIATDALYEVSSSGFLVRPILVVRCEKREFDVYINTGMILASLLNSNRADSRIRLDSEAPTRVAMVLSTDETSLFFQDPAAFVNDAINAEHFTIEFTRYDDVEVEAEFDIRGLYDAVQPVTEACK